VNNIKVYNDCRDDVINKRLKEGTNLFEYLSDIFTEKDFNDAKTGLVEQVAKKFSDNRQGVSYSELLNIGAVGLLKARHSYKEKYHITFMTYAARCIDNEIIDYLNMVKRIEDSGRLVYRLNNGKYIYIQTCDTGYDYTIYNAAFKEIDGGQIDQPDISIPEACDIILEWHELTNLNREPMSIETFEEIQGI